MVGERGFDKGKHELPGDVLGIAGGTFVVTPPWSASTRQAVAARDMDVERTRARGVRIGRLLRLKETRGRSRGAEES